MTLKNIATVERLLGVIEGVTFALDNKYAQPICECITTISEIINRDKEGAGNDR